MDLHTVDWHARQVLRVLQPTALQRPERLDLKELMRHACLLGVEVEGRELGGDEGRYYPAEGLIVLCDEHYHAIVEGAQGEEVWRAASTLAHELGHHVLRDDPRVRDEEADAWAFAGCILMPCDVVRDITDLRHTEVARTFHVSPQMALAHLKRMKKARMI